MCIDLENNIGVLCTQEVSTKFVPRHEASKLSQLLCQVKFIISEKWKAYREIKKILIWDIVVKFGSNNDFMKTLFHPPKKSIDATENAFEPPWNWRYWNCWPSQQSACHDRHGSGLNFIYQKYLGVPIISSGSGDSETRAHAPNESISLDLYVKGARHFARILKLMGESWTKIGLETVISYLTRAWCDCE